MALQSSRVKNNIDVKSTVQFGTAQLRIWCRNGFQGGIEEHLRNVTDGAEQREWSSDQL
jgi:hypothetical protein